MASLEGDYWKRSVVLSPGSGGYKKSRGRKATRRDTTIKACSGFQTSCRVTASIHMLMHLHQVPLYASEEGNKPRSLSISYVVESRSGCALSFCNM